MMERWICLRTVLALQMLGKYEYHFEHRRTIDPSISHMKNRIFVKDRESLGWQVHMRRKKT